MDRGGWRGSGPVEAKSMGKEGGIWSGEGWAAWNVVDWENALPVPMLLEPETADDDPVATPLPSVSFFFFCVLPSDPIPDPEPEPDAD